MASDDLLVIENGALLLAQITARVASAAEQAMQAINVTALLVETEAKKRCPVDTGRLRSSIHTTPASDPDAIEATVSTDVEYGPYIELGTVHMSAQPFLLPAFVIETAQLEARIAAAINAALSQS